MNRRRNSFSSVRVAANDRRPPMLRLLADCRLPPEADGRVMVAVAYDQQWRTLWRAQVAGYIDAGQYLTDKGRAFLTKFASKVEA